MSTRLYGTLINGLGKPIVNATVTLIARSNTLAVLGGSEAVFRTDAQGAYNITVNAGHYVVIVGPQGTEPYKAGEIVLYADSADGSLNGYLVDWVEEELTPDVIKQVQDLVATSQEFALQAERASASANADATDARNSKAAAASSASSALTYKNDAKKSANAAKTSQTSAAGSANTATQAVTTIQGLKTDVEKLKSDTQTIKNSAVTETTKLKDAAAASATQASNSATEAGKRATNAGTSATAAKKDADRAKTEADRAEAAANNTPEIQPLPDVWIPFNDSLDMITGFAPGYKTITVGDDVVNMVTDKVVDFTRASSATYINKAGVLTVAEINEPRFEREGLLVEGQRSNAFANSNDPSSWNYASQLSITNGTDDFGFTYGVVSVIAETSDTGRCTFISTGYPRSLPAKAGESLTISCRVKKSSGDGILTIYMRIAYVNADGSSNTLVSNAYINVETGEVLGTPTGGSATKVYTRIEPNGWVFASLTYTTTEAKTFYGRIEVGAHQRDVQMGDQWLITTPQYEVGNSASSFIISGSTTTTRASDQVIIPIPMNWATPPICALMEVNVNWGAVNKMPNIEGSARLLNVSITGSTTEIQDESYMYFGFTTGGDRLIITNGKGTKTEYKAYGDRVKNKLIAGFRFTTEKNLQVVVDGVFGSASPSLWTKQQYTAGAINIGGQSASGNRHLFGHVRNLKIWHKELTDRQMKESV